MSAPIEKEDIVTLPGWTGRRFRVVDVLHANSTTWLWLAPVNTSIDGSSPFTVNADRATKVMAFFEPGKLYRRRLSFSVRAQQQDTTEYFKPEVVQENSGPGRSGRIAFGAVTFTHKGDGATVTQWEVMGNYDWVSGGWKECK